MKKAFMIQEYAAEIKMKTQNNLLPAEYLLVLQPHEALWEEIAAIKKRFQTDYKFNEIKIYY